MSYHTSNRAQKAFEKAYTSNDIPKLTNGDRDAIVKRLNEKDSDEDLLRFFSIADGEILDKFRNNGHFELCESEEDRKEMLFALARLYISMKRIQAKCDISREELYKAIDAVLLYEEYNIGFDDYINVMRNKEGKNE